MVGFCAKSSYPNSNAGKKSVFSRKVFSTTKWLSNEILSINIRTVVTEEGAFLSSDESKLIAFLDFWNHQNSDQRNRMKKFYIELFSTELECSTTTVMEGTRPTVTHSYQVKVLNKSNFLAVFGCFVLSRTWWNDRTEYIFNQILLYKCETSDRVLQGGNHNSVYKEWWLWLSMGVNV